LTYARSVDTNADPGPEPVDRADALRHDVEALEHDAEEVAERAAGYALKRVAPVVVGLVLVAWLLGRRARRRHDRV
jgi:hypothetical protein